MVIIVNNMATDVLAPCFSMVTNSVDNVEYPGPCFPCGGNFNNLCNLCIEQKTVKKGKYAIIFLDTIQHI